MPKIKYKSKLHFGGIKAVFKLLIETSAELRILKEGFKMNMVGFYCLLVRKEGAIYTV